jgi:hypothetical protein
VTSCACIQVASQLHTFPIKGIMELDYATRYGATLATHKSSYACAWHLQVDWMMSEESQGWRCLGADIVQDLQNVCSVLVGPIQTANTCRGAFCADVQIALGDACVSPKRVPHSPASSHCTAIGTIAQRHPRSLHVSRLVHAADMQWLRCTSNKEATHI